MHNYLATQYVRNIASIRGTLRDLVSRGQKNRGFSLIELLAVMGVLIIVTSLILANNNKFGGRILLENLAYDIGLSVREAQVYGISVRRFGVGTEAFSSGYGIHFDRLAGINPSTTYVLFADAFIQNGRYDCANPSACELVESTQIQGGFHVIDLCIREGGVASETCGIDSLDILFRRPEPDACIAANGTSALDAEGRCIGYERGRIILESPRLDQISIVVESTGQISVE